MTPRNARTKMERALREITVKDLRKQDFQGTFPHFRRKTNTVLHLISFQFEQLSGYAFAVNLAVYSLKKLQESHGQTIPLHSVTAYHTRKRSRLSKTESSDHWFVFYVSTEHLIPFFQKHPDIFTLSEELGEQKYERIAQEVTSLLRQKADTIFNLLENDSPYPTL